MAHFRHFNKIKPIKIVFVTLDKLFFTLYGAVDFFSYSDWFQVNKVLHLLVLFGNHV